MRKQTKRKIEVATPITSLDVEFPTCAPKLQPRPPQRHDKSGQRLWRLYANFLESLSQRDSLVRRYREFALCPAPHPEGYTRLMKAPQGVSLTPADHILAMLPIEGRNLFDMFDITSNRCNESNPPVMHYRHVWNGKSDA
jgi:hypothetical protein